MEKCVEIELLKGVMERSNNYGVPITISTTSYNKISVRELEMEGVDIISLDNRRLIGGFKDLFRKPRFNLIIQFQKTY